LELEDYIRQQGDKLLRFAYLQCGDRSEAEDLMQDVMLAAARRWDQIVEIRDIDSYFRKAIVNRRNTWWRRRKRAERQLSPDDAPVPSTHVLEARLDAWELLRCLTSAQRAALVLRFYEDMSYEDVAQVLGCSIPTARSHVHRGLRQLRSRLDGTALVEET
jgi:RNA polymerase sigma-70 factor (sigma-E family)